MLSGLLLVRDTRQPNKLAVVDVQGSPQKHKPAVIVFIRFSNQVKILFPVKKLALTHRGLPQCHNHILLVLAYRGIVVVVRPL